MEAGDVFGEWTIVRRSIDKPSGYWLCECSCGVRKDVWASSLKSGASRSCGHTSSIKTLQKSDKRMIGKRFGRLVVLKRTNKSGRAMYLCQCDCGREALVKSSYLTSGKTKSCGCLRSEKSRKSIKHTYEPLKKEIEKATRYGSNIHSVDQKVSKNSSTGHRGVSKRPNGKYRAYLYFKGKQFSGGNHDTLKEAIRARKELEKKYFDPIKAKYKKPE